MKPFLYRIAELFYGHYGSDIHRIAFVFPNRRAGLFFRKYLSEIADKPLFSPSIWTINDLFARISGKQPADRIRTLFSLYEIYRRKSGSDEAFDDFVYWGEMLLNDFDDIDKYLVDARKLFVNVTDLKALEDDYSFLSEEQIAAIRSFWSSFHPKSDSPNKKHFLELWEVLYDLYAALREELASKNSGYEGMLFRDAVEYLERHPDEELPFGQVVFVGLNALSVSEERLLLELQRRGVADFYWDYASAFLRDKDNKASFFMERNLSLFPSRFKVPHEDLPIPDIEVISVPSAIGEAKQVYHLLESFQQTGALTEEEALRTAIVLPDEHLLIPVLNAIPDSIQHINVTMGYPLIDTPVASLMDAILSLQKNRRYQTGADGKGCLGYYYRDVLPVLNHQYVAAACGKEALRLVEDIQKNNRIYIKADELLQGELLSAIFTPLEDVSQCSDYLITILEKLNARLRSDDEDDEEKKALKGNTASDVEQEFVFHYFATINKLKELIQDAGVDVRIDTYFRLLKRMTELISIPFEGEPLSGLQIMGVLETRALDFDRVILLSMNDGVFPMKRAANSFIPYNLRRGFALPTYEHQDSIWAYHFYRLIQRAGHVTLLYDSRSGGLQVGEVSRYVLQLKYHYGVPLQEKIAVYDVSTTRVPPIRVAKDAEVWNKLAVYGEGGDRALSASAINTYLDCPLKFYFSYVEHIEEEENVSEMIESDVFGSILHKVMEILYKPLQGKLVTSDILKRIRTDKHLLTDAIWSAFAEVYFKSKEVRPLEGQNYLIGEMIRIYAQKIVECDARYTPFHYVESEKQVHDEVALSDGNRIRLKGYIDRVDAIGSRLRIVDYKTGRGLLAFDTVQGLFDKEAKERPKAVMQVFLYAWMYGRRKENEGREIEPAIYYLRTLFEEKFDPTVIRKVGRSKSERVENFQTYKEEFEAELHACLEEIFDRSLDFIQTENDKVCAYCRFRDLCGR